MTDAAATDTQLGTRCWPSVQLVHQVLNWQLLAQVHSSDMPEIWNMLKIVSVAVVIAVCGTASVIILLIIASPTLVNG